MVPTADTELSDDFQPKKDVLRDEDGEFQNTRQLNNQALLQQNKDQLAAQDKALDRIGDVVTTIRYENNNFK